MLIVYFQRYILSKHFNSYQVYRYLGRVIESHVEGCHSWCNGEENWSALCLPWASSFGSWLTSGFDSEAVIKHLHSSEIFCWKFLGFGWSICSVERYRLGLTGLCADGCFWLPCFGQAKSDREFRLRCLFVEKKKWNLEKLVRWVSGCWKARLTWASLRAGKVCHVRWNPLVVSPLPDF